MDFKSILIYAVIVVVIAVAVAYVLSTQIHHTYDISVTLRANVPASPYPYQTGYFRADINNTGSGTATDVPLLIYLNGNPIVSYKVTLPPGKGGAVAWNYTFQYNGTYQFQAIADPGHVFSISNRPAAQGSISVIVNAPQSPNVYSSISNNNITSTQSFTLLRNGSAAVSLMALGYNTSILNGILGPARSVMLRTLQDLSDTINLVQGAVAYYPGNQIAYTAWIQGTITPTLVGAVVNSYSVPISGISANGTKVAFARVTNTTSMCFYYSNGWTKIISYYNSTVNATCASISGVAHTGNASSLVVGASNETAKLRNISSIFVYSNSSYLGSALTYSNGMYGAASIFSNQYGTFMSYLKRNSAPVNLSVNSTCNGIIYPAANVFVCSSGIAPIQNSGETTDMINETVVTENYTASIYSFVNRTNLLLANNAGINLLLSLNLSNRSAGWNSTFVNTCALNGTPYGYLPCRVASFSHKNYTATIGITSALSAPITLTSIACYTPGIKKAYPINIALAPGGTANVATTCTNPPIPLGTISTTYGIAINYTVAAHPSTPMNVTGQITIINQA